MYSRINEWRAFSNAVEHHIEHYTLPQYSNPEGTEQIDNFTPEECFQNILRYLNRRNTNVRGRTEQIRDLLKIAHYASFIHSKLTQDPTTND